MPSHSIDPSMRVIAEQLADLAGPIARQYFRAPAGVEFKSDASPVTLADRGIESAMRTYLADHRPDDGVFGEEFGTERLDAEYVWVLDPIDGTKAFITGKPSFVTLIGLVRGGEPVLGVIDQPITGERWVGVVGEGAWLNGEPVQARSCAALAQAIMNSTAPDMFTRENGALAPFERLRRQTRYSLFGGDGYAYGQLACGYLDLVCEASMKPFDMMGPVAVVLGAGGAASDWTGAPLTLDTVGDRILASGDPALHRLALEHLADA